MNTRNFLKLTSLKVIVAAESQHFGLILPRRDPKEELCDCGSRMEARINGRCAECATADEIHAFLFQRGLRSCPHSHHSSDEEFAECARRKEMNMENIFSESDLDFLKSVGISTDDTSPDADRMALVQRIAKHQAPGQVNVDPQAASRQLIRLSLEKLLNASEE